MDALDRCFALKFSSQDLPQLHNWSEIGPYVVIENNEGETVGQTKLVRKTPQPLWPDVYVPENRLTFGQNDDNCMLLKVIFKIYIYKFCQQDEYVGSVCVEVGDLYEAEQRGLHKVWVVDGMERDDCFLILEEARLVTNTMVLEQLQSVSVDYNSDKLTQKLLAKLSSKQEFSLVLKFRGINLADTDIIGKSDPYLEVVDLNNKVLYRTETIRNNLNPNWKVFSLAQRQFAPNWNFHQLILKVFDRDLIGRNDLIGQVEITGRVLMAASKQKKSLTWRLYEKSVENCLQDEVPVLRGKLRLDYALPNMEHPDLPELKVLEDELVFYNKHRGSLDNILAELSVEDLVSIEDVLTHGTEMKDDKNLPYADDVIEEISGDKDDTAENFTHSGKFLSSLGLRDVYGSSGLNAFSNEAPNVEKNSTMLSILDNSQNPSSTLSLENIHDVSEKITRTEEASTENFASNEIQPKNDLELNIGFDYSPKPENLPNPENSSDPIISFTTIRSCDPANSASLEDSGLENPPAGSVENLSVYEGSVGIENSSGFGGSSCLETTSGESGEFEKSGASENGDDFQFEQPNVDIRPRERRKSQVVVDFNKVRRLSMVTQRNQLNFRSLDGDTRPVLNRSLSLEPGSQNWKEFGRPVPRGTLDQSFEKQTSLLAEVADSEIESNQDTVLYDYDETTFGDSNQVEDSKLISELHITNENSNKAVSNEATVFDKNAAVTEPAKRMKSGSGEPEKLANNQLSTKNNSFKDFSDIFNQNVKSRKELSREISIFEEYDEDEIVPKEELDFVCSPKSDYLNELRKNPGSKLTESFTRTETSTLSDMETSKTGQRKQTPREKLLAEIKKAELSKIFVHSKVEKSRSTGFSSSTKTIHCSMGKLSEQTANDTSKVETPMKSKSSFDLTENNRVMIGQNETTNHSREQNKLKYMETRLISQSSHDLTKTKVDHVIGKLELANQNQNDEISENESSSGTASLDVEPPNLCPEKKLVHSSSNPTRKCESRRSSGRPEPGTQKRSRSLTLYVSDFENETPDNQEGDQFVRRVARSEEMTRRQSSSIQKRLSLKKQRSMTQKETIVRKEETETRKFTKSITSAKSEQSLNQIGTTDFENLREPESHGSFSQDRYKNSSGQDPHLNSETSLNADDSSITADETEAQTLSQTRTRASTQKINESTETAKGSDDVFPETTDLPYNDDLPVKFESTFIINELDKTRGSNIICDPPTVQNSHRVEVYGSQTNSSACHEPSSSPILATSVETNYDLEPKMQDLDVGAVSQPIGVEIYPLATIPTTNSQLQGTSKENDNSDVLAVLEKCQSEKSVEIDKHAVQTTSESKAQEISRQSSTKGNGKEECLSENLIAAPVIKASYQSGEKTEFDKGKVLVTSEPDATETSPTLPETKTTDGRQHKSEDLENGIIPSNVVVDYQSYAEAGNDESKVMTKLEHDASGTTWKFQKTEDVEQDLTHYANAANIASNNGTGDEEVETVEDELIAISKTDALESLPVLVKTTDDAQKPQSQEANSTILLSNVATGGQLHKKANDDESELMPTSETDELVSSPNILGADNGPSDSSQESQIPSAVSVVHGGYRSDGEFGIDELEVNQISVREEASESTPSLQNKLKDENNEINSSKVQIYKTDEDKEVGTVEPESKTDALETSPKLPKAYKDRQDESEDEENVVSSNYVDVVGDLSDEGSEIDESEVTVILKSNVLEASPVLSQIPGEKDGVQVESVFKAGTYPNCETKGLKAKPTSGTEALEPKQIEMRRPSDQSNEDFFDNSSAVPEIQSLHKSDEWFEDLDKLVASQDSSSPSKKSEQREFCTEQLEMTLKSKSEKPIFQLNEPQLDEDLELQPERNNPSKYWIAALSVGVLAFGSAIYKMRYSN